MVCGCHTGDHVVVGGNSFVVSAIFCGIGFVAVVVVVICVSCSNGIVGKIAGHGDWVAYFVFVTMVVGVVGVDAADVIVAGYGGIVVDDGIIVAEAVEDVVVG